MANRSQNKHIQSLQRTMQTPVYKGNGFHVQLWEILGLGALGYFGYKMFAGRIDANTANAQADKAGTDVNTQQAIVLYSAMVPGIGPTDSTTVLNLGSKITNFAAVTDAYKNLYQRVLTDDLAKYLSAADLQGFMQSISNANVNQGTMDVNQEAATIYAHLHPVIPDYKQDVINFQQDMIDIYNSGASNPLAVLNNIKTAYKAKFGADYDHDSNAILQNYVDKVPGQSLYAIQNLMLSLLQNGEDGSVDFSTAGQDSNNPNNQ